MIFIFQILLNLLLEPNHNNENVPSIKSWNQCAMCFRLLQEMLKMQNLYEQIEEKLSISVRNMCIIMYNLKML